MSWPLPADGLQVNGQVGGQVSDIEIQAKEMLRTRQALNEILAKHTGQTVEKIHADTDRDNIMTAEEARTYGLVDAVFEHRVTPDAEA